MGRTGEVNIVQPDGKRLDKHLEVQLSGPEFHADYFRTWAGHLPYARPGRKRNLLREWQILRFTDCIPRAFKGIDGHRAGGRHSACHLPGWEARNVRNAPRGPEKRNLG